MAFGTESKAAVETTPEPSEVPEISVCETCPGRVVFLESGNTDAWMSSDVTVDVPR